MLLFEFFPHHTKKSLGIEHNLESYLYVGGPGSSETVYNESGTAVRQSNSYYGLEGESSSVSGDSVEPVGYTYDGLYRTKSLSDGNSHSTSYTYNQAGYLYQVTYPDTHTFQYVYDNFGNTTQRTDGRGVVTNYTYNDTTYCTHDALTAISYPASTSINVAFTYDAYGRMTAKTDGAGSYTYIYDDNNTAYSMSTTYTGLTGTKTVSYGYNNDGSRASMSTPSGGFTYTYDGAGRVTSVTNPASETLSWTYLDNNWIWKQQMGSTELSTYTYNALGQITDLAHRISPSNVLLSEFSSLTHDGVGNLTAQTINVPGRTSYTGTVNFTYDNKDQLTQEASTRTPSGFPTGYTNTFGYDTAGNATSFKGVTRTYNSSNQNTANTYDNNGNPTTYSGTSMTYDAENRLTAVGSLMTAGYTSGGQRAWKQNSTTKTYFIYDGLVPVSEIAANGTIQATNTFGATGLAVRNTSLANCFYTFDPQGNVVQRMYAAGGQWSVHMFSAYGTSTSTISTTFDPYSGFGGQAGYYTDWETGLQLCGSRYYDAAAGRFITRDPIGYNGGVNVYNYTANNPVNRNDSNGRSFYYDDPNGNRHFWLPPNQGTVPTHPPDINLGDNINQAQCMKDYFYDHSNGDYEAPILHWFYNHVRNKGPWDYKQRGRQYQDFGNFNYGATGGASGIDLGALCRAAGYAQCKAGTSLPKCGSPWGGPPYGDDPSDQEQIRAGYNYWWRYYAQ